MYVARKRDYNGNTVIWNWKVNTWPFLKPFFILRTDFKLYWITNTAKCCSFLNVRSVQDNKCMLLCMSTHLLTLQLCLRPWNLFVLVFPSFWKAELLRTVLANHARLNYKDVIIHAYKNNDCYYLRITYKTTGWYLYLVWFYKVPKNQNG